MYNESGSNVSSPLISVCIPVYNGAKFIIQLLESIKNQTYRNFKCHLVNNASTDDTEKLAIKFSKTDPRFFVHTYNEFANIVTNWNRTVNHIDGNAKYFKVVQADDYLMPDSLESLVDLMEKHPSAGIGTSYRIIGDKVDGFGIHFFEGNFHNGKQMLLRHLYEKTEVTGSITQLFFRIERLKQVPGYPQIFYPEEFHDDTRLAYEMLHFSDMVFAFKILNYTRRHESAETITTVDKYNTLLQGRESRLYRFLQVYPELERKYKKVRREYGYFLFKAFLKRQHKTLDWHKKFLKRKIKKVEILSGIIWENRFGSKLAKLLDI